MKNEIKEILDRLERIDHKENKTAFEFADSATFDEMARCFKERKMMADYITNLQEKINKLTAESTEWEERTYCWKDRAKNLEIIIDKAIEYINIIKENTPSSTRKDFAKMILIDYKNLLNILNGGDEE